MRATCSDEILAEGTTDLKSLPMLNMPDIIKDQEHATFTNCLTDRHNPRLIVVGQLCHFCLTQAQKPSPSSQYFSNILSMIGIPSSNTCPQHPVTEVYLNIRVVCKFDSNGSFTYPRKAMKSR